jgi:uncharacterized protein YjbI with pentapeptide repeats
MGRITTRLDEEPLAVYRQLEHVSPEDRAEIVFALITQYGRLDLPLRDGFRANLSGVNLSTARVKERLDRLQRPTAPWWDDREQKTNLQKANLHEANLREANLEGVNLREANLQEADLQGANLQRSKLTLARLERTKLWEALLQKAQLNSARLYGTRLWKAQLQEADFWRADLQRTNFYEANLRKANFRNARFHEVDLSNCADLAQVYLEGAFFNHTRMRFTQLNGAVGEEFLARLKHYKAELPFTYENASHAQLYTFAKHAYVALKQNFYDLGDYEAASWAYRKERLMEKMEAWTTAQQALKDRHGLLAVRNLLKCTSDQLVEWTCGYGESIGRVLATLGLLLIASAALYGIFGAVVRPDGTHLTFPRDLADLVVFSLNTMTNTDLGQLTPANDPLAHLAQGVQTLCAIFLTGLLGFVVGNRIRRA